MVGHVSPSPPDFAGGPHQILLVGRRWLSAKAAGFDSSYSFFIGAGLAQLERPCPVFFAFFLASKNR